MTCMFILTFKRESLLLSRMDVDDTEDLLLRSV
jgi:hypothetical protein